MKLAFGSDSQERSSVVTHGVADLMTSLAVIFILLFAAYVARVDERTAGTNPPSLSQAETQAKGELPYFEGDVGEPGEFTVAGPDSALQFEFGKSALLPTTEAFLAEAMPHYASVMCGPEGRDIQAFVIEGYTDDLGDDVQNLRLSQDRSFAVLTKSLKIIHDRLPLAYECFLQKATANGRGRQNLLRNETGYLDREKSRRVVFKIYKRST